VRSKVKSRPAGKPVKPLSVSGRRLACARMRQQLGRVGRPRLPFDAEKARKSSGNRVADHSRPRRSAATQLSRPVLTGGGPPGS
jgi:hypothetical protein